ncbi:hypothetical protein HHK36_016239 [Tetracentron sinense]|uniref:Uncharacterized protein n=1 Tax=Tetracentron sinense TaxID=13715 RepID=A0A834Z4Y7_TETSI|nr:hypothetical protein HHK36_016239 [Tetracentron sinense]
MEVLIWADILAVYAMWMMMTYLTKVWKLNFTHAAAMVNIFIGSATIMPIGMSYLAETCLGNFGVLCLSSVSYSIGLSFLAMSTPPILSKATGTCSAYEAACIGHVQAILFYAALALIAVGLSGHVTSLGAFFTGQMAIQKEEDEDALERRTRTPCICLGVFAVVLVPIIGGIALPYIKPWSVRFGIPAICSVVATPVFEWVMRLDKAATILSSQNLEEQEMNKWRLCRVTEVEETKITIRMIPITGVLGAGIMGSALSVYITGKVSERGGRRNWFQDTLNKSRLDNYYWTLAVLSSINLVLYALVAICYAYRESTAEEQEGPNEESANALQR